MYDKVSTNFEFVNREKKVLDFWNENHIFEKSIDSRKNAETFTFYDGPPTANGKPHKTLCFLPIAKDRRALSGKIFYPCERADTLFREEILPMQA